mgnify:CR=1 FL=1
MKYDVQFTSQFKKDLKLAKKQHKNLDKLFSVINTLANGETLNAKYKDHDLMGNYKGTRECHIEPDWLLVYEIKALQTRNSFGIILILSYKSRVRNAFCFFL